jgi:hypothetical protein
MPPRVLERDTFNELVNMTLEKTANVRTEAIVQETCCPTYHTRSFNKMGPSSLRALLEGNMQKKSNCFPARSAGEKRQV